jgi:hypothetical protein
MSALLSGEYYGHLEPLAGFYFEPRLASKGTQGSEGEYKCTIPVYIENIAPTVPFHSFIVS